MKSSDVYLFVLSDNLSQKVIRREILTWLLQFYRIVLLSETTLRLFLMQGIDRFSCLVVFAKIVTRGSIYPVAGTWKCVTRLTTNLGSFYLT